MKPFLIFDPSSRIVDANKQRHFQNVQFCSSSMTAEILTGRIHGVFETDAEI
jgi:hypothetical protein